METKAPILEYSRERFEAWIAQRGLPAYRARQVWNWLTLRRAESFDDMSDLPRQLRGELDESFQIWTARVAAAHKADDGTEKLVLELGDAERIECVLLRDDKGHFTCCVSTQAGCAMGCAFCASGMDGFARNLTRGEITEQLLRLQRLLDERQRLSHIVVMGMGEPLANLDALLPALALATAEDGLGIGARRVTISTVGLPQGIRHLADYNCQYHLAVSLHAPDDETRNQLIPHNRKVGIANILEAADYYFERTGRRVTYEYVLLSNVNDRMEQAEQLVALLKGRPALINLIPYNPVASLPFNSPSPQSVARFVETLRNGGLNVEIRRKKGDRVNAACGQLRRWGE
jgi:23S rRNA (adenine2503-C2)-methyltransferase